MTLPAVAVPGDRVVTAADVPQILATIRKRESGNNYTAQNKSASASGAYQYINSTWKSNASQVPGASQYPTAKEAPPAIQDAVATKNVMNILNATGFDLAGVPIHWYYPKAYTNAYYMTCSPSILGPGNTQTVLEYATGWIKDFDKVSGTTAPVNASGAPVTLADTVVLASATPDTTILESNTQGFDIHPLPAPDVNGSGKATEIPPGFKIVGWASFHGLKAFNSWIDDQGNFITETGVIGIPALDKPVSLSILDRLKNSVIGAPLKGIEAVGAFFSKLTSGQLWIQVAQVLGGLTLIGAGIYMISKDYVDGAVTKVAKAVV